MAFACGPETPADSGSGVPFVVQKDLWCEKKTVKVDTFPHCEGKQRKLRKMWKSTIVLLVVCGLSAVSATQKLQERYNWKQLDFVFPNQRLKQQALASGDYVPTNGLPVGIERWENKLFVSVPRWKDGNYRGF